MKNGNRGIGQWLCISRNAKNIGFGGKSLSDEKFPTKQSLLFDYAVQAFNNKGYKQLNEIFLSMKTSIIVWLWQIVQAVCDEKYKRTLSLSLSRVLDHCCDNLSNPVLPTGLFVRWSKNFNLNCSSADKFSVFYMFRSMKTISLTAPHAKL